MRRVKYQYDGCWVHYALLLILSEDHFDEKQADCQYLVAVYVVGPCHERELAFFRLNLDCGLAIGLIVD